VLWAAGDRGRRCCRDRRWEPGAGFLGADGDHGHVALGGEAGILHPGDCGEAGQNSGGAVVVAALRDRVKVAAEDDPLFPAVAAGQRHVEVAGGVGVGFQPQALGGGADEVVGGLLAGTVGVAGDADAVEGLLVEGLEEAGREVDVGRGFVGHQGSRVDWPVGCGRWPSLSDVSFRFA
jgi:hypothetical protein